MQSWDPGSRCSPYKIPASAKFRLLEARKYSVQVNIQQLLFFLLGAGSRNRELAVFAELSIAVSNGSRLDKL